MVDQPDFEKMTPDEIMAWMETLAKRQGATEGFTTEADLDIPEVDPDSVVIDEPGYVPYTEKRSGGAEAPEKPVAAAPVQPPPRVPPVTPVPQAPPAPTIIPPAASTPPAITPPVERPAASRPPLPAWSVPGRSSEPAPAPKPARAPEPEPQGSLAWLESLAQQNEDSLFNLDLSGLGEDAPEPAATDPNAWLKAMAATPDLESIAPAPADTEEDDTDSLRWLESLARRQGAPAEELTTSADLDVSPVRGEPEAPAYTPFSFNTVPTPRANVKAADPADFLGSLAAAEGYSEAGVMATREPEPEPEEDIEEIKRAISEGRVTPEQMHTFFEHQVDIAETLPPGEDELGLDEEPAPVRADLPDWLVEQMQEDEPVRAVPEPPSSVPLEKLFDQADADIPDWLREDDSPSSDLDGIFAETEAIAAEDAIEIDLNDPWVEALDLEHTEGMTPVDSPPDWYLRNVSDPARLSALEGAASGLRDEPLPPESSLPPGKPVPVPPWMQIPAAEPEALIDEDETPEWLREMENVVASSEIPAWLNEPAGPADADSELPFDLEEALPTPEFVIGAPTVIAEPEPEPASVQAAIEAPALASARARRQAGDLEGALNEYDALIRAGSGLQECADDLAHVARLERENPVVFRVLGDAYMRLGKLQLALDTYREALNHL